MKADPRDSNPWSNTEFGDKALPTIGEGCDDCLRAACEHWHGFAATCKGCQARGLGRIFLGKGERGRRLRMACEQFGLTLDEVKAAHAADALAQEQQA